MMRCEGANPQEEKNNEAKNFEIKYSADPDTHQYVILHDHQWTMRSAAALMVYWMT